jgi:hypothetical protein
VGSVKEREIESALKALSIGITKGIRLFRYMDETEYLIKQYVYFIQQGDDGPIKVGTAHNVEKRLADLQIASPHKLNLRLTVNGDASVEYKFHCIFKKSGIRGEWFHPSSALLRFIRAANEGKPIGWLRTLREFGLSAKDLGITARGRGTNPRSKGLNPRALGTNPLAVEKNGIMVCKHGVNIKVHICQDCVLAEELTLEGTRIA